MKKIIPLCILVLTFATTFVHGQDFTAVNEDNKIIYYNIISDSATFEVEVTNHLGGGPTASVTTSLYSGIINIPSSVVYNDTIYTVTQVGNLAFRKAANVTHVSVPSTVTTIGYSAFEYCSELVQVTLQTGLITIETTAFSDCTSLEEITLPHTVTAINGGYTFFGCSTLSSITSLINPPPAVEASAFWNIPSSCVISVPESAVAAYNAAPPWTNYAIVGIPEYWLILDYNTNNDLDSLIMFEEMIVGNLPAPTREGYTFGGWFASGIEMTEETIWNFENDLTAIALWQPISYELAFDMGIEGEEADTVEVTFDQAIGTLPAIAREGYTLLAWTIGEEVITEETIWNYTEDQTAVAQWEANTYQLTLVSVAGIENNPAIEVVYDAPIGQIPTPQLPNDNFLGWFIEDEEITDETIWNYTEDQIAIAKWSSAIDEETMTMMKLYPNPANDIITLETEDIKISKIELIDLSGRVVMQPQVHQKEINIENLEVGIYFIRITTDKEISTLRFVKQ